MRKFLDISIAVIGFALFSSAAFAGQLEEAQEFLGDAQLYALALITIVTVILVYFGQLPENRAATLQGILSDKIGTIHSVEADALVVECVRKMTDKKIGALMVMDAGKLVGIFTERDALSRVLAAGRDPRDVKVVEVMTADPCYVSPKMTVNDAMELLSKRRFRHLPIVEDGKVQALLSNRDLTYWLVKNQNGDVKDLVEVANHQS